MHMKSNKKSGHKISRREFARKSALTCAGLSVFSGLSVYPATVQGRNPGDRSHIRLGGPLFGKYNSPGDWVKSLKELGYRAAYCPLDTSTDSDEIRAYREAAAREDIIISEVGTWCNPISPDDGERRQAIEKCIDGLRLADEIGAACCVNVSGSRSGQYWAGPHMDNLTEETFEMVVDSTRKVIDSVRPTRTWFTLEAMPWAWPYSADSYLRLIKAIDRDRFAVHYDPVNLVVSPEIYFRNGEMIRDFFRKLGPRIKSCHAKDIVLREDIYTVQFSELRPGLGKLDYSAYLTSLSKLHEVPLMMEHLETEGEYEQAAGYIRKVAGENGIDC